MNVGQENDANRVEELVSNEVGKVLHKSVVIDGELADRIIELAEEYNIDLIAMPTYNGRVRTFLIGSVTAKFLHDLECPVLTGVHRYDDSPQIPDTFRSILCGLDDAPGCIPLFHWFRTCRDPQGLRFGCSGTRSGAYSFFPQIITVIRKPAGRA